MCFAARRKPLPLAGERELGVFFFFSWCGMLFFLVSKSVKHGSSITWVLCGSMDVFFFE